MNGHRRGHSYRKPRPRIFIVNPAAHRLRSRINQLKLEIKQAGEIAAWVKIEPVGLGEKQEALEILEKQLRSATG